MPNTAQQTLNVITAELHKLGELDNYSEKNENEAIAQIICYSNSFSMKRAADDNPYPKEYGSKLLKAAFEKWVLRKMTKSEIDLFHLQYDVSYHLADWLRETGKRSSFEDVLQKLLHKSLDDGAPESSTNFRKYIEAVTCVKAIFLYLYELPFEEKTDQGFRFRFKTDFGYSLFDRDILIDQLIEKAITANELSSKIEQEYIDDCEYVIARSKVNLASAIMMFATKAPKRCKEPDVSSLPLMSLLKAGLIGTEKLIDYGVGSAVMLSGACEMASCLKEEVACYRYGLALHRAAPTITDKQWGPDLANHLPMSEDPNFEFFLSSAEVASIRGNPFNAKTKEQAMRINSTMI